MAKKKSSSKPASKPQAAARKHASATATELVKSLFEDSPGPSFSVTVQVGRAKRSFACEAKNERGARQKAMKYYRGMYPDRECKVVASGPL